MDGPGPVLGPMPTFPPPPSAPSTFSGPPGAQEMPPVSQFVSAGPPAMPQGPPMMPQGPPMMPQGPPVMSQQAPATTITEQMPGPAAALASMPLETQRKHGMRDVKSTVEFGLREYMTLQRRRRANEAGTEDKLRIQAGAVLSDLRVLRRSLSDMTKAAESHRWRRWLVGGALASFIPVIRAIFPRPKEDEESANDTEYAFGKSKSLIRRILDSVQGRGGLASFAFFVFAVLYVFQNEVTLRVARTAGKRLKRLGAKIEEGQEDLTEKDLELLQGWRWRVLLWSS